MLDDLYVPPEDDEVVLEDSLTGVEDLDPDLMPPEEDDE